MPTLQAMLIRSPAPLPFLTASVSVTHSLNTEMEVNMTIINLQNFYLYYTADSFIEVPDKVAAEAMTEFNRKEAAYRLGTYRHKGWPRANTMLLAYANKKIEKWDTRRQKITKAIADLSVEITSQQQIDLLSGYLDDWENISFEDERKAEIGNMDQTTSKVFHLPDFWRQIKSAARITQSKTIAMAIPMTPQWNTIPNR